MTFKEYQKISRKTATYPGVDKNFVYPTLGLAGESGEVAGKIKKIIRDNNGVADKKRKQELTEDLGDVLWYLTQIATELGISLDEIALLNVKKIQSRKNR